ncbi:2-oxo-tetronate isomerase [Sneathiella sp.]|uniref:2-oxo-tetronate isomerase n=1 Tax=Sneathiella sp. TaxID=1964365 RepID=UPI002FE13429
MSLKFAANLSFLYQDLPFLDRFAAAAEDGFKGVEFLFPYEFDAEDVRRELATHGLTPALFNFSAGDFAKGDRGLASLAGRRGEFRDSLAQGLAYARAIGAERMHLMAGLRDETVSRESQYATFRDNLRIAADMGAAAGVAILIEAINTVDMPGYFLDSLEMATALIEEINHPYLGLQFDVYHVQRMHGDITRHYRAAATHIRHMQIANPPHRHEPDNGEINYPFIFDFLEKESYSGWIGCEYIPSNGTRATLGWAKDYLSPPR